MGNDISGSSRNISNSGLVMRVGSSRIFRIIGPADAKRPTDENRVEKVSLWIVCAFQIRIKDTPKSRHNGSTNDAERPRESDILARKALLSLSLSVALTIAQELFLLLVQAARERESAYILSTASELEAFLCRSSLPSCCVAPRRRR